MIISHKIGQLKVGAHTKNYVTKGDYYNAELAGQNLLFLFFVFCFVFVLFLFCFCFVFVLFLFCFCFVFVLFLFCFCFVFVLFLYLYKGNFVTNQSCISDRSFSGRYRI